MNPPEHLSTEMKAWWTKTLSEFTLEPHHLLLLQSAAESWDRQQQARSELAAHGLTFKDEKGVIRANPAVAIERDSAIRFARLLRELALDAPAPEAPRSPRTADYGDRR